MTEIEVFDALVGLAAGACVGFVILWFREWLRR